MPISSSCSTLLCASLVAALCGAGLAQSTWYVDASATPPGNGTPASPYTEVLYAIQQPTTVHGDTLLVAPGTYDNFGTAAKALSIVSTGGPEVTVIDGSVSLYGSYSSAPFLARLQGFTVLVGSLPCTMDLALLERCIVKPKVAPGGIALRCGEAYGGSDSTFRHCSVAGFSIGIEEVAFSTAYVSLRNSVFDCIDKDIVGELGSVSHSYSYATKVDHPSVGSSHPVPGPSAGLWDSLQGDVHLLPLSACIDAGDPALPPDPDGSLPDAGALPYDPAHAPQPATYCAGFVHSGGCAPRMDWSGTPSLSGADDFVLKAGSSLNKVLGLFLVGAAAKAIPFSGGNLCVAPPFLRGPAVSSGGSSGGPDCSGVFSWPVSHAFMQQQGWQAGQILYAQCWGRDPGSAYPEKSQLSNGLVFKIEP
jgi:hypothetical protein